MMLMKMNKGMIKHRTWLIERLIKRIIENRLTMTTSSRHRCGTSNDRGELRPARRCERQGRLRDVPAQDRQDWAFRQTGYRYQLGRLRTVDGHLPSDRAALQQEDQLSERGGFRRDREDRELRGF